MCLEILVKMAAIANRLYPNVNAIKQLSFLSLDLEHEAQKVQRLKLA
jgi:hypothetical protein